MSADARAQREYADSVGICASNNGPHIGAVVVLHEEAVEPVHHGVACNRWLMSAFPQKVQQLEAYSITSSARASNVGGTMMPSTFAVRRLMTSSNLIGACTGRSAGFSPLRMRST